jgi:methionyl aminopeptidase
VIVIKSRDEVERIAEACRIVAEALEAVREAVAPGVSTRELERMAEEVILARGGRPAFKGYRGYPASICTSVNEQVVHGIPSDRRLEEGDIVSIDLGVVLRGYYGDAALTVPVGRVSPETESLMEATREALDRGIEQVRAGNRVSDISHAVQRHAEARGFSVVRDFVGHGIGTQLHEEPQVPNFGRPGTGVRLREGMTLAIEPMVNAGGHEVRVLPDGWTAVSADGSLSAHFEHTVAVTADGARVLTRA